MKKWKKLYKVFFGSRFIEDVIELDKRFWRNNYEKSDEECLEEASLAASIVYNNVDDSIEKTLDLCENEDMKTRVKRHLIIINKSK